MIPALASDIDQAAREIADVFNESERPARQTLAEIAADFLAPYPDGVHEAPWHRLGPSDIDAIVSRAQKYAKVWTLAK